MGSRREGLFCVNPPRSSDRKRRNRAVFIRHGGGQTGTNTGANRSSVCSSHLVDFAVKCCGQDSPDGSFKGTSGCRRPSAQSRNTSGPLVLQLRVKLPLPPAAPLHLCGSNPATFWRFISQEVCLFPRLYRMLFFYLWRSGDWSAGFSTRRKWTATLPPTELRSTNLRFLTRALQLFSDIIDQKYNISIPMLRQIRLQVWS